MYKLKVKDTLEAEKKKRLISGRDPTRRRRRHGTQNSVRSQSHDEINFEDVSQDEDENDFENRFQQNRGRGRDDVDMDGDQYGDQAQYNNQNFGVMRTNNN